MAETRGEPRALEALRDLESGAALAALAELAVKLRETGLLDLLIVLAENYDEALDLAANGPLSSLIALGLAAGEGARKAGAVEAAATVEKLSECTVRALKPDNLSRARPVTGLLSLLRELSDPRVARGLGLLLHLARSLGECLPGAGEAGQQ